MARRTVTASNRASAIASPTPHATQTPVPSSSDPDLALLRRQWKWAAFSQFFYTFSKLFAMEDVTIMDIEEDLVHSRAIVLPRIMARMLSTLSGDKKTNLDNWQIALRRQYMKRNPTANPLGPEPPKESADYDEPTLDAASRLQSTAEPDQEHEPKLEDTDGAVPESGNHKDTDVGPSSLKEGTDVLSPVPAETTGASSPAPQPSVVAKPSSPEPPAEESKDWLDLPMLEKLDSMQTIAEWHFDWPQLRIRKVMRDDDEGANWRIEPIGYDSKTNAYWLIGAERLWIQRALPKPPRPPKRKRAAPKAKPKPTATAKKGKQAAAPIEAEYKDDEPELPATSRGSRARATRSTRQTPSTRAAANKSGRSAGAAGGSGETKKGDRAAKRQANIKLDAQAKAFAEYKRETAADSRRSSKRQKLEDSPSSPPTMPLTPSKAPSSPSKGAVSRPVGTRVSRRLRGTTGDEEWQEVPEEWLKEPVEEEGQDEESPAMRTRGGARRGKQNQKQAMEMRTGTGLESDLESASELTSLSDDLEGETKEQEGLGVEESEPAQPESEVPADFVEWELIAVTLYEWEHVADPFARSTHYSEKALYKLLTNDIVPFVTEELREIEKKKKLEEAIVHRKRSSRIASKVSAREQARIDAEKRAEEEKALGRARRAEARQKQEEDSRARREEAREKRRKEREEKEKEEQEQERGNNLASSSNGAGPMKSSGSEPVQSLSRSGTASGVQTPSASDWEVDCEVCGRRGINMDGDIPLVQCEVCKKWQHQQCHNRVDEMSGRRRRNWNHVDYHFMCQACQPKRALPHSQSPHPSYNLGAVPPPPVTPTYPPKGVTLQWNHSRSGNNTMYPATGTTPYPGTGGYVGNQTYAPAPGPLNGQQAQYSHSSQAPQGYGGPIQFDYYQPPGTSAPLNRAPAPNQYAYGGYLASQGHTPGRWNAAPPATSMNGFHRANGLPPPPQPMQLNPGNYSGHAPGLQNAYPPQAVQLGPGQYGNHAQRTPNPAPPPLHQPYHGHPPLQPRMDSAPS
ncbi:hypothetical protein OE88DRAFT_1738283 [Heliocybe sulcata]|uniref:PHD-type domain-containing protein n=1 Tax=Heliocybe sulcata TaxID=5364 RepID=A0A5C3MR28_9AGAM|nr:hypothetical protein OE88DRAFT_1738283 [Heliocybe sulcata]